MDKLTYLVLFIVVIFISSTDSNQIDVDNGPLSCYECNVWKAGYGHDCNAPRNRSGCFVCMKVETTVFMGYYKNTPRYTTVISRVCAKTKAVAYSGGCQYYKTVDGHSRRCYCNKDNCNKANAHTNSFISVITFAAFASLLYFRFVF